VDELKTPEYFRHSVIRDEACGLVGLSKTELEIINLSIFQRLRRIHQNGLLNLVFPSATHTRFSHSLGVLYYADLMCAQPGLNLNDEDTKVIRLAALLHDIGHYPFSHAIETVAKTFLPSKPNDMRTTADKDSKPAEKYSTLFDLDVVKTIVRIHKNKMEDNKNLLSHEIIGSMIIERHPALNRILKREFGRNYVEAKKKIQQGICGDIADGRYKGILHSELDADKCDYLMRDSRNIGVPYGFYELEHIIKNMKLEPGSNFIVFRYKALKSIEHFMFARYFLYNQIFYHKTNMGFNWLAGEAYNSLLNNNEFLSPEMVIKSIDNNDFDALDDYDDYSFLTSCKRLYDKYKKSSRPLSRNDKFYFDILEAILRRKPLKIVLHNETFFDVAKPDSDEDKVNLEKFMQNHSKRLCRKTRIPDHRWIIYRPFDVPVTKIPSSIPLEMPSIYSDRVKTEDDEGEIRICYRGEMKPIRKIPTSIVSYLANLHLCGAFVYAKDEYEKRIMKYIRQNLPDYKVMLYLHEKS
jgi:HD superfamily phosphohydrolase